jgi:hypothetical protein
MVVSVLKWDTFEINCLIGYLAYNQNKHDYNVR